MTSLLPPCAVYSVFCLYSKKRYCGLKWTSWTAADGIDVKGLQLVRRDSAPIVKDVSNEILSEILYRGSSRGAVEVARSYIAKVLQGDVPLDKFIVSKALRGDYKNQSQPHLVVAKKILRRTGAHIPSGVRVPYVFIEDPPNADSLLAERAEDPAYVRENNLTIDRLYYIRNQLQAPITTLLSVVVENPVDAIFEDPDLARMMAELEGHHHGVVKEAKRVRKNKAHGLQDITNFFKPT